MTCNYCPKVSSTPQVSSASDRYQQSGHKTGAETGGLVFSVTSMSSVLPRPLGDWLKERFSKISEKVRKRQS